jgi:hypothetical protein
MNSSPSSADGNTVGALTKRQVEILLGAIDTNRLASELDRAARWVLGPVHSSGGDSPTVAAAKRVGWSAAPLDALTNGDGQAMAELAVELAERRTLD